ncbi:hypothetical protein EXU57_09160 [Segetibacter sp. 3557_3]|uniref:hypothetical protein n=1 Tax=Segetibacter sp. 3557_3 TaxID=2547429 RepID=UPI001058E6F6|nr:hypothetical protein [Segetibacter sp. 3557_3]TDH26962.1 hypothetical protein EXU57_09160 [Segetibacter sp. 3557_3]
MKNTFAKSMLFTAIIMTSLAACKKDNTGPAEKPFVVTDHYVAGTITPANNAYNSVYMISLLENNKAVFISSGNNFTGDYTLTKDSLIVIISDPANYRVAKFAINEKHELTSAYYRALTTEYKATGKLLEIEATNQLAGKTFKGEEFKMGPVSFKKDLVYKFSSTGTTYGSGTDPQTINDQSNAFELINNSAFKFKSGSNVEMGFYTNNQLTVFRLSGLYYFGTYTQQ